MRFALLLAGLLCSVVASGQRATGDSDLFIDVTATALTVDGVTSSAAHDAILRKTIDERFAGRAANVELQRRPDLPPGWALVTELTMQAMAESSTATARVTPELVSIRGYTSDIAAWRSAAGRIRDNLLPGMAYREEVAEIRRSASLQRQCVELFRTALRGRKIEFEQSSAELRTAVMPLLDELILIATDCPESVIVITGHTDSSGNEPGNVALSQARANAVRDYMTAGGIAASRLSARGLGSAEPLAPETSAQARRLNRRIDIELRFP
jgi:OOP family OmpA-OmpF porin